MCAFRINLSCSKVGTVSQQLKRGVKEHLLITLDGIGRWEHGWKGPSSSLMAFWVRNSKYLSSPKTQAMLIHKSSRGEVQYSSFLSAEATQHLVFVSSGSWAL